MEHVLTSEQFVRLTISINEKQNGYKCGLTKEENAKLIGRSMDREMVVIYKSNNDKKIYIAVLNKDYISKILDMIKISGNPNLNISIYSDSEVKEEFILFQLRNLKLVSNVSIYKNMGQPDFGFFPINPYLVKSVNY
jgi:uncharacterized protein YcgL (UPF0745 family)